MEIMDAFNVPFICHIPPIGYGVRSDTGEVGKTDVIKRSNTHSEQYWVREELPSWYAAKEAEEELIQESDPDYEDIECAKIRERHWQRRLYGCWFYNKGVPTYITGLHWFMLNWWKYGGTYMDYREPNRDKFYVIDYCIEDPKCLGLLDFAKRRDGKTLMAGVFLYEYISRTEATVGGIQSKNDIDAKDVFKKAIIGPWRKLPNFFRPIFDTSSGDDPKSELRFYKPSVKGRKIKSHLQNDALESVIDYRSRGIAAYDGSPLHRYVSDEAGKLKDVSIVERHNTVRFCAELGGKFIGKFLVTSTVEEMESGGKGFKELVKQSDRSKINANGRTTSGLYAYFTPAYKTIIETGDPIVVKEEKKFGIPDESRSRIHFLNEREGYRDNPRELSSIIRKNPFTVQESFRVDGEKSLWNSQLLNEQLDWLSWHDGLVEKGNFEWRNGERFTEVIWVKCANGRWQMPVGFKMEEPNKVECRNGRYYPKNVHNFRIGCDPFKYSTTKTSRRSDCAAFVGKMLNPVIPSDIFNNALICRYRYRAATTSHANEDILKMAWFFGSQILFESNVDHWKFYFTEHGCEGFLMLLQGEKEYGIYSDGQQGMIQAICDRIEHHIESSSKKLFFKETVTEYLEFDPGDTTTSDETIASGITLVAMEKKTYRKESTANNDVSKYVKRYKAA